MRICAGIGTEVIGAPRSPSELVGDVGRAKADGFPAAWCVHFSRGVATEIWPTVFDLDAEPGSSQRTVALLRSLAPALT